MIVRPARKRDRTIRPAILHDPDTAQDLDTGRRHPLDKLPPELRCFAAWDTVDQIARTGTGELVCWGDEPIRYRHRRRGDSHRRKSDVVIVKLPVASRRELEEGLTGWADWLDKHQVNPGWSLGGTSMALLRATLEGPLVTTNGQLPPARWTLGGRQQSWHEPGTRIDGAIQLDLQAAYTTVIGNLHYGGAWRHVPQGGDWRPWHDTGHPVLVHGRTRYPHTLPVGPLHRRPRKRPDGRVDQIAPTVPYPVAGRHQGIWTADETVQALEAGVTVDTLEAWVHVGAGQPFLPWLDTILQGRQLAGFAGQLAKATGNALWGQFVIDDTKRLQVHRFNGRQQILHVQGSSGHQRRAWDLGELVTGTVRAKLYRALSLCAADLVCCHTDGAWIRDTPNTDTARTLLEQEGWRCKSEAAELQLIDQQKYRYRLRRSRTYRTIFAGCPSRRSEQMFQELWQRLA